MNLSGQSSRSDPTFIGNGESSAVRTGDTERARTSPDVGTELFWPPRSGGTEWARGSVLSADEAGRMDSLNPCGVGGSCACVGGRTVDVLVGSGTCTDDRTSDALVGGVGRGIIGFRGTGACIDGRTIDVLVGSVTIGVDRNCVCTDGEFHHGNVLGSGTV